MKTPQSQIIIYKTKDGQTKIDVRFDGDTVWLTQKLIAELFGVEVNTSRRTGFVTPSLRSVPKSTKQNRF